MSGKQRAERKPDKKEEPIQMDQDEEDELVVMDQWERSEWEKTLAVDEQAQWERDSDMASVHSVASTSSSLHPITGSGYRTPAQKEKDKAEAKKKEELEEEAKFDEVLQDQADRRIKEGLTALEAGGALVNLNLMADANTKVRNAQFKGLASSVRLWPDAALRELCQLVSVASMKTAEMDVMFKVQMAATGLVLAEGKFQTGGANILKPNHGAIPYSHSGAAMLLKVYGWIPGKITNAEPDVYDAQMISNMCRILREWNYQFDAGGIKKASLARTSALAIRNCETLLLMDDTVSEMSYNGYLQVSCAQLVIPGATTEQLINMGQWMIAQEYVMASKRIVIVSGINDWLALMEDILARPGMDSDKLIKDEVNLMIQ